MKQMAMSKAQHSRSHLFIVRVWVQDLGDGKTEWRGQVKHVMSGEVRYFREWATLVNHLLAMSSFLEELHNDPAGIS